VRRSEHELKENENDQAFKPWSFGVSRVLPVAQERFDRCPRTKRGAPTHSSSLRTCGRTRGTAHLPKLIHEVIAV
jgi:hypothetical protein